MRTHVTGYKGYNPGSQFKALRIHHYRSHFGAVGRMSESLVVHLRTSFVPAGSELQVIDGYETSEYRLI